MSVVLVVTIEPIEQHRDEVVAAFAEAIAVVHAEDAGCERYALHEGDGKIVLIEKWTDEATLAAHGSQPALLQLRSRLEGKLAAPPTTVRLAPIPAGTAEQGLI